MERDEEEVSFETALLAAEMSVLTGTEYPYRFLVPLLREIRTLHEVLDVVIGNSDPKEVTENE